jgi:NAD(P)H-nitrite reductase large subunit
VSSFPGAITECQPSPSQRGEEETSDTLVEPGDFYNKNDVEFLLKTEVASVHPHERAIETRHGKRHCYGKLLIATGAVPRRLEVEGADLSGVFTVRTLDDASAIREAAAAVRDAVVIGSGFIGMEVAASLTELGLETRLVDRGADLFAQLGSPEISEHLVDFYRGRGLEVIQGVEVRAFGGHSALGAVELHTGEQLDARLAVIGIGVDPAVGFLEGSGLAIGKGVVVNERFETSVPGIYAVGDVVRSRSPKRSRPCRSAEATERVLVFGSEPLPVLSYGSALE